MTNAIAAIIANALLWGTSLLLFLLIAPVLLAGILLATLGLLVWQAMPGLLGLALLAAPIALACWLL